MQFVVQLFGCTRKSCQPVGDFDDFLEFKGEQIDIRVKYLNNIEIDFIKSLQQMVQYVHESIRTESMSASQIMCEISETYKSINLFKHALLHNAQPTWISYLYMW